MLFLTLRDSLKVSSKVVFLAFLTNIAIDMGSIEVYNSMEMSSMGLEDCEILFIKVRNHWLKYLIFYLGSILILERSKTNVAMVLYSPKFSRKVV
jgi:hypothetical protein